MRRLLIAFVATASVAAFVPVTFAGTIITNINFKCAKGSGTGPGGALCSGDSPASMARVSFSSWNEGGYNISMGSTPRHGHADYNPNPGGPQPGLIFGGAAGNYNLNVTGPGDFYFNFLDLGGIGSGAFRYSIFGFLNGTQEFDLTGELCQSGCGSGPLAMYQMISGDKDKINDLKIIIDPLSNGTDVYLDDMNLMTPEPSTLILLGTGILALAFFARRGAKSASPAQQDLIA